MLWLIFTLKISIFKQIWSALADSSGRPRIFLGVGAPTLKVGVTTYFFAENCLKMKESGPRRGRPWRRLLDPPIDRHIGCAPNANLVLTEANKLNLPPHVYVFKNRDRPSVQEGSLTNLIVFSSSSLRKWHPTVLLSQSNTFPSRSSSRGRGRSSRTSGPRDSRLLLLRSRYLRFARPSKAPASIFSRAVVNSMVSLNGNIFLASLMKSHKVSEFPGF